MKKKKGIRLWHIFGFVAIVILAFVLVIPKSIDNRIREPAFAGTWYPADKEKLNATITQFLDNVQKMKLNGSIKAIIVPHAGYIYSGQVAAAAFKQLDDHYDNVFLIGPSHQFVFEGASVANSNFFKTPLGLVGVSEKANTIAGNEGCNASADMHLSEHCLEMELPFLQNRLKNFEIVPVLVGAFDSGMFSKVISSNLGQNDLIVVSVDLSHYHSNEEASALDNYSIGRILALDDKGIMDAEIDAPWAVAALLDIAKQNNWRPVLVSYKNSGDVTGDQNKVVGYAAIVFVESYALGKEEQNFLLKLSRQTLEDYVKLGKRPKVNETELMPALKGLQGCFVTLNKNDELRGCIGDITPTEPLYRCVIENTINAAVNDGRFSPVKSSELQDIKIEISVLTVPKKVDFDSGDELKSKLMPLVDGVVLKQGWKSSTYLPQVWEQLPDKEEFLTSLCLKGGMKADCWKDTKTEVMTYRASVFSE